MASKPSVLYRWATAVGALVTAPSGARQDTGWVAEEPPADVWNAVQKNVYEWLDWLRDIANQTFTWTQAHVFQGNVTVQGTATLAALAATNLGLSGNLTVAGTASVTGALSAAAATLAGAVSAASATIAGALSAANAVFTGTAPGGSAVRAVAGASTNALDVAATGAGTRGIVIDTGSGGTGVGITFAGANLTRGEFVLPLRTADPTSPVNGEVWLRHDLHQLCVQVAGVTRRISMTP